MLDLDCAIPGYPAFNQNVEDFQQRINASIEPPIDLLKTQWQLEFAPDKTSTEQYSRSKSYTESVWTKEYYCTYISPHCSNDEYCCDDYHYVDVTKYYTETTTIQNSFQGILTGRPFSLPPLDCGFYSRMFETLPPVTAMTYESPHRTSGRKENGATYINFEREYGSFAKAFHKLDSATLNFNEPTLRIADQERAATNLTAKLFSFLSTAIAAFNMAGANYPEIRDGILNNIPKLIENATALNATLMEQKFIMDEQKSVYDEVHGQYEFGKWLWISMLLTIPPGLAFLTYKLINKLKNENLSNIDAEQGSRASVQDATNVDLELGPSSDIEQPAPSEALEPGSRETEQHEQLSSSEDLERHPKENEDIPRPMGLRP